MKKIYFFIVVLAQLSANAVTWKVGSSQTYTTPSQVVNLVGNGDTIKFDAGTYLNDPVTWIKKDLVFIGLGTGANRSIMKWKGGDIANGKGLWVFGNPAVTGNITIDNIVFEGARVSDANGGNGAGIRYQAKDLKIRNCRFDSCQNGILEGGGYSASVVSIINSEFFQNGYEVTGNATYSGYEHNIYISAQTDSLLVRNCWFHNPRGEANSLKTRAQKAFILYNLIDEENGQGSWEVNIAQGGLNIIMGNVIVQGPNSINHGIVSYDAATNALEDFYFINNTVINKYNGNFRYFNVTPTTGITKFKVYNNVFAKLLASTMTNFISGTLGSALDTLGNRTLNNYTTVGFVNPAISDYHITTSATSLINNCVVAGNASNGFPLQPVNEYLSFSTSLGIRILFGAASDIGAYENTTGFGVKESGDITSSLIVYPNPAKNYFRVQLEADLIKADTKMQVYDVNGKMVKVIKITEVNTEVELNSELKSGVYFYDVLSADQRKLSGKLIVE